MVRPTAELARAAAPYVCVRAVNMAGVDLETFRFDYDLTFAALLMNADGTIYHQYGARDERSADSHLSAESFARLLRESLAEHADYERAPRPPEPATPRTIEQMPTMARRIAQGKKPDCFHCHMVNGAMREQAQEERRWSRDDIWTWPGPERGGLRLARDDQALVESVEPKSPAAKAGLRAGDRIAIVSGRRVRSYGDMAWALDGASGDGATLALTYERDGGTAETKLRLPKGWRAGGAVDLAWRSQMWSLSPKPGFGGKRLTRDELTKAGLPADAFAMRIGYIVDWGDESHTGRNAKQAGLRKGDVVLSIAGRSDFASEGELQAWFRLTQRAGTEVKVEILRDGKRVEIRLPVVD